MTKFKRGDKVRLSKECLVNFLIGRDILTVQSGYETATYFVETSHGCGDPSHLTLIERAEEYVKTKWVICGSNPVPHEGWNCPNQHQRPVYLNGPLSHEHEFVKICKGCGANETEPA